MSEGVEGLFLQDSLRLEGDEQRLDAMALAEYEAVPVGIVQFFPVNVKRMEIQGCKDIETGKVPARMAGISAAVQKYS